MTSPDIIREHDDSFEYLARAGYAARGAVYLIIGYFAFRAAFADGKAMSSKGAIDWMFGNPFGTVLMVALIVALVGFCIWRIIQCLFDADHRGSDAKGLAIRTSYLLSGAAYAALAFYAGSLLFGMSQSSGGGSDLVRKAYEAGFGAWATYLIGAAMAAVGGVYLVRGAKATFMRFVRLPEIATPWLKRVCQAGLIARGLTFFVIAFLLFTGAASSREGDTPGTQEALQTIAGWSFGWALLSLMGLGLIAFGVYGITEGLYRRIEVDDA